MSTIHLHLTVQQMPSGKWVGRIRRDDHGMPLALGRPHDTKPQAAAWVLAQARDEFSAPDHDEDTAA